MNRKIFSSIIILIGVIVISYPILSEKYQIYKQERIMKEWQENLLIIDNGSEEMNEANLVSLEANNEIIETHTESNHRKEQLEEERLEERLEKEKKEKEEFIKNNMEGILEIEKINIELPILRGATQENLKISVASMEGTGKPGEIGNYVIAGHRSHTYGRNFNRLDEIEKGDVIYVSDEDKKYEYIVTQKLYVLPEEIWVLNKNNIDKEITLITCHPMVNPTHRLIVKGKMVE